MNNRNNRNVLVVVYGFTIYEVVLKKEKESRVDAGSIFCGWQNI